MFITRFQHPYFRMYSDNNFLVNGIMKFFGLINAFKIIIKQIDNSHFSTNFFFKKLILLAKFLFYF